VFTGYGVEMMVVAVLLLLSSIIFFDKEDGRGLGMLLLSAVLAVVAIIHIVLPMK